MTILAFRSAPMFLLSRSGQTKLHGACQMTVVAGTVFPVFRLRSSRSAHRRLCQVTMRERFAAPA
jgi:hypothetical protein